MMMWHWMLNFEHTKVRSSNKFKKWNPFVTDEFPYETLILRKRLSVLYTKCIQFFYVSLSTFLHMLCGWNDDTMPTFNLFRVHFKWFSISWSHSSKQSVNAWKITNEVRKDWKMMMWLWMVHFEHTKSQEFK